MHEGDGGFLISLSDTEQISNVNPCAAIFTWTEKHNDARPLAGKLLLNIETYVAVGHYWCP